MEKIWVFWLSIHPGTEPGTRSSPGVCQHLQPSHHFTAQPWCNSLAVTQTTRLCGSDPSSSPTVAKDVHSCALCARRQRAGWVGRRWQKLSNHSLFFFVRALFHPRTPSPWVTGTEGTFSSFSSDISSVSARRQAEMTELCVPRHTLHPHALGRMGLPAFSLCRGKARIAVQSVTGTHLGHVIPSSLQKLLQATGANRQNQDTKPTVQLSCFSRAVDLCF